MKIGITSDHRGYELKQQIIATLEEQYEITDCGTRSDKSVDYPDYAFKLGNLVAENKVAFGIAICGSGIGISIACNKVKGIRCSKVCNKDEAKTTRNDNDANIMAFSAEVPLEDALQMIENFINTPFSTDERHQKRVEKIKNYEENCSC